LTASCDPRSYRRDTQREVITDMNGMLQHPDVFRDGAERHQREARAWAEANALGRAMRATRRQYTDHPGRTRAFAVVAPAAAVLALLALVL
jgi:hypothetical protein